MFTASAGKYRKVNKVLSLQNLDFGITYWNKRQPILIGKQRKQYKTCRLCFHNYDSKWGARYPSWVIFTPGGQDKPAGISYPPGVKITRVGGKISRDSLPPGGQAVQGGKINCYTGSRATALPGLCPGKLKREQNSTASMNKT